MNLTEKLNEFTASNADNPDMDLDSILTEMIENIGHPDPELRDRVIYTTFYNWVTKDILSPAQLIRLLQTSINDEHLFYKIGERGTDSVFTRSFSSLAAALVIEKDAEILAVPKELIMEGIRKSIFYLNEERDTRGYVQSKGWAHSIAHGADLLAAAINHPYFNKDLIPACLGSIRNCYGKEAVYMDDEDERLIFAIEALLKKGLTKQEMLLWLGELNLELKSYYHSTGFTVPFFRKKKNLLDFMKSLYFRIGQLEGYEGVRYEVHSMVNTWHTDVYTSQE
ncbi:DUF2785 domain-containing protein [Bacillus salacetis]|uniref:DUF2785 domain-containing protein n=1 Tax=Bacillus salacetis TaxID=2315464 RepID=A0A3A1R7Q8_9BACI|nr:DUF2785 domain-containing protein [Bacillus salacetis]RIW38507.1 DUF2785 domain-containing protein [Bacillus salacetis]